MNGSLEHMVNHCSIQKGIGVYSTMEADHGDVKETLTDVSGDKRWIFKKDGGWYIKDAQAEHKRVSEA